MKLNLNPKNKEEPIINANKKPKALKMKKYYSLNFLIWLCFGLVAQIGFSQTIMFDDFNYTGVNDPELSVFNKWNIIDGVSGPPEGGIYSRNNIDFVTDPTNSNNKIMTLKTTVNGQTRAITHARIESSFEYFEGTYASRVYLSDESFYSKDANIQTFYTIVSSALAQDGSKYSEMDIIEYMAADKWGISPDNRVGYTTSYHKYIAVPWTPWKTYNARQESLEGWHTFIATCTDGIHINYYMDNILLGTHSVTDNQTEAGLSVYPRSTMQIAFANWIWNNVLGTDTNSRDNTFKADWVLHYKDTELNLNQINDLVASYRSQGLKRRNLAGQTFIDTPDPTVGKATLYLDCPYSGTSVTLSEGSYTMAQLVALGMPDDSVSSLKVQSGYKATLYWDDNFTGDSLEKTSDDDCLTNDEDWNDKMTSIVVSKINDGGSSHVIEAEDYTYMGGVELESCSEGGQNVGYIDATDWMSYNNINFPASGNYLIEYRVASAVGGGLLSADLNAGTTVLGEVSIPNTGGWQNWITVSHIVNVNAGTYAFGIYAGSGGWNINWIKITKQENSLLLAPSLTKKTKSSEDIIPKVYSSPTNDFIYVNGLDHESIFTLYDLSGKTLLNVKSNLEKRSKINIESLESGLYIYKIIVANKSYSGKIIKQ